MNADVTSGYTVYPAIDVRNGCVVRLAQGDYARETRYRPDPLALAKTYADAGAAWLHLVDLDAARGGGYTLAALVECIKAETALKVQSGGGVRNDADLARLFGIGIDRVIVGSLAVGQRKRVAGWLAEHGAERITLALDARRKSDGRWWSMTHGWVRNGGETLGDLVRYYSRFGLR
ncbi:MAG: HisA/HisF-related TIM barrel protein, partial [Luteimonas sp.]